jgi:acetyltransferase-like isoleucine patch superfamily enzyme
MNSFIKIVSFLLPWFLRRRLLNKWFGFQIHPTARIGLAWVFPKQLDMGPHSHIDHFTIAIHLDKMVLQERATIGRNNWITGFPTEPNAKHFKHQTDRKPELLMGISAAITKSHHIDCTSTIEIGPFATIAGYQTQLLTHSIDVVENRQDSAPIYIGAYTFVGTNSVILGGACLPDYSVLGAKSLLNKPHLIEWTLYGGVPARPLQTIPPNAKYFSRKQGFVY